MRRRYLQDPVTLELIEVDEAYLVRLRGQDAPQIMGDIRPYQSMIDGTMISSRSHHRAHLRQHGCIEVGNETKYLKPKSPMAPPGLKDTIIRAAHEHLKER
jgi:hypothetical protein